MIIIPYKIFRSYVQKHPEMIFLYGHDYLRRGCLGQAWELYNEPNTYAVPTLYKYCANAVFFQDCCYDTHVQQISSFLLKIPNDGRPVIPCRKIGEGCSRMKEFAPKLFAWLQKQLTLIATPHEIDYKQYYGNS